MIPRNIRQLQFGQKSQRLASLQVLQGEPIVLHFKFTKSQEHPGSALLRIQTRETFKSRPCLRVAVSLIEHIAQSPPAFAPVGLLFKRVVQESDRLSRLVVSDCSIDARSKLAQTV